MSSERGPATRRAKASGAITPRTTARGVTKYEARVSAPGQGAGLRRQYGKTFTTRADAQRWLNTELAALSNGMASADPSMTLRRWLESWLAHTNLRPTSRRSYRDLMQHHVIPRLGSVRLVDLRPGQLNEMYGTIMEDSNVAPLEGERPRRPVSPATIHKINAVLRSALSDAERDGYVPRNVARLTRLPKKVAPPRQWWTVQQVHDFTEATADDRLAALWVLLLRTGLRRGEALGLRWIDVDLDTAGPGTYPQARVVQQITTVGGVATRGEPKTDNGRRVVVLDGVVVAASWPTAPPAASTSPRCRSSASAQRRSRPASSTRSCPAGAISS
jgi:integrase